MEGPEPPRQVDLDRAGFGGLHVALPWLDRIAGLGSDEARSARAACHVLTLGDPGRLTTMVATLVTGWTLPRVGVVSVV